MWCMESVQSTSEITLKEVHGVHVTKVLNSSIMYVINIMLRIH